MEKYNYYENMANDINEWIKDNYFNLDEYATIEDAAESLVDELWNEDCITGNCDGYASEKQCEEFLTHNLDLIIDTVVDFDISRKTLLEQYNKGSLAKYLDCVIRLNLLYNVAYEVLRKSTIN